MDIFSIIYITSLFNTNNMNSITQLLNINIIYNNLNINDHKHTQDQFGTSNYIFVCTDTKIYSSFLNGMCDGGGLSL